MTCLFPNCVWSLPPNVLYLYNAMAYYYIIIMYVCMYVCMYIIIITYTCVEKKNTKLALIIIPLQTLRKVL